MSEQTLLGILALVIAVFVIFVIRSRSEQRQQQGSDFPGGQPAVLPGGQTTVAAKPRTSFKVSFSTTTSDETSSASVAKQPGDIVSENPVTHTSVRISSKLVENHLQGPDREVLERWLGVSGGQWTDEQKAKFAAAFERFIWDGEGLSIVMKQLHKVLRAQIPTVQGTPLDIDIPPDVRAVIAKITGSAAAAGPS